MTTVEERIFFEAFEGLPRQGPGNDASTLRALALCSGLGASPRVLDLGCGCGAQTLALAGSTTGEILAIDTHAPLVKALREKVEANGLAARVEARVADMATLEIPHGSYDLIWSEGALYNMGIPQALKRGRAWLRSGGWMAFTDAVWRRENPPEEVRAAFADYPLMGRAEDILALLEQDDWDNVSFFELPEEAWWVDFYGPLEQKVGELRVAYAGDPEAQSALDGVAAEVALHREFGDYYGYAFGGE